MEEQKSSLDYIAGNTIIQFTDSDPALLRIDAIVEEQDTNLLLGKSPVVMHSIESFPALVSKMEQQTQEIPGSVIIKPGRPKRFIAIIYDVESDPICKTGWLDTALNTILTDCEQYSIKTLALPLLGIQYGKLEETTVLEILQKKLNDKRLNYPKRILIYTVQN